tara:strand:- start:51 stop:413 length:363 start_codon:yes stop_codon:yes gene_type:complete
MIKKNKLFQQRAHLGGHLKNTCTHVYDILDEIQGDIDSVDLLDNVTVVNKHLENIKEKVKTLKEWLTIPMDEAYQYSPYKLYDDMKFWEEKYKSSPYVIKNKDLDKIRPSAQDVERFEKN